MSKKASEVCDALNPVWHLLPTGGNKNKVKALCGVKKRWAYDSKYSDRTMWSPNYTWIEVGKYNRDWCPECLKKR